MKYNYSGPGPIFAVLGVIVFWVLFQVVPPDASVGPCDRVADRKASPCRSLRKRARIRRTRA